MSRRRRKLPLEPVLATIEALSHEGRGITHVDGKTIFVDGALKGESVMFRYRGSRAKFAEGSIEELIDNISVDRVEPVCKHYSVCGGCSLQHISTEKQIEHKEQVLQEQLQHIGGVIAEQVLPPLTGPLWAYRHKARLGVKYVAKKNKVLVGFREKYSSYVADIDSCEVLHPSAGKILRELGKLISGLSVYNKIAQIEVAVSGQKTVLIFRNLTGLSGEDINKVDAFANQYELTIYLQPGGPSTVMPLPGQDHSELSYLLEEGNIGIQFSATDFTQVNVDINQQMVKRVVSLMDIQAADNVLDLYCGLGNFTLPMALKANQITGVEGAEPMVEKARHNAKLNNIENVNFISADLSTSLIEALRTDSYDKVLLDPPRSGAQFVVEEMKMKNVRRLIYVSCNPATLARDAGILVRDKGFKLVMAGVMDMFPHTSHVESIAVFEH
jgi:23S rRNA (uracil1939-C5)-methyltransferase